MLPAYKPKHFGLYEFVDETTFEARGTEAWRLIDSRLVEIADLLREQYGPMFINTWKLSNAVRRAYGLRTESGLRMPYHVVYSKYSDHTYGRAFDALFKQVTAKHVRQEISSGIVTLPYNVIIEAEVPWLHIAVVNCSEGVRLINRKE